MAIKNGENIYRSIEMVFFFSLAICIILLSGPATSFSTEGVKMKESPVLWPAEAEGWKIAEGPTQYDPSTAYTYMNGAAELFIAFNMRTLTVVRYEKAGQPAITIEIYRMAAPEDAYGLFTFESDDPKANIGQGSEFGGGLLRFWKANYFISVYGDKPGAAVESATLSLGRLISTTINETGKAPKILALLPDRLKQFEKKQTWYLHSHILLNQRFFIAYENILNLAGDVNVALGRYMAGADNIHLLVIKYPSKTRANDALRGFRKTYMKDGTDKVSVNTENNKWTAIMEYGEYLAIVFDAPDEPFAKQAIELAAGQIREDK